MSALLVPVVLLVGGGVALALTPSRKSRAERESHAIGTELATLPEESRTYLFRMLLTVDPSISRDQYTSAILQMRSMGLMATAKRLTEIVQQRDAAGGWGDAA